MASDYKYQPITLPRECFPGRATLPDGTTLAAAVLPEGLDLLQNLRNINNGSPSKSKVPVLDMSGLVITGRFAKETRFRGRWSDQYLDLYVDKGEPVSLWRPSPDDPLRCEVKIRNVQMEDLKPSIKAWEKTRNRERTLQKRKEEREVRGEMPMWREVFSKWTTAELVEGLNAAGDVTLAVTFGELRDALAADGRDERGIERLLTRNAHVAASAAETFAETGLGSPARLKAYFPLVEKQAMRSAMLAELQARTYTPPEGERVTRADRSEALAEVDAYGDGAVLFAVTVSPEDVSKADYAAVRRAADEHGGAHPAVRGMLRAAVAALETGKAPALGGEAAHAEPAAPRQRAASGHSTGKASLGSIVAAARESSALGAGEGRSDTRDR